MLLAVEANAVVHAAAQRLDLEPVAADQSVAGDPSTGVAELGRFGGLWGFRCPRGIGRHRCRERRYRRRDCPHGPPAAEPGNEPLPSRQRGLSDLLRRRTPPGESGRRVTIHLVGTVCFGYVGLRRCR